MSAHPDMRAAIPSRVATLPGPPATDPDRPRKPRRRRRSNLLALAVLSCLAERPMHPYEMATTMRTRGKHDSIKLNYGSLYGVVEGLERDGLVARVRTVRDGRRPERTIYQITESGRVELTDWEGDLLAVPVKEFTRFEAGLSLIVTLDPEEAVQRLHERCGALEAQLAAKRGLLATCAERNLPRLFVVELEYRVAMLEAELAFTRTLAREIETGTLDGTRWWRAVYDELASAAAEGRQPAFPEPYEPPERYDGGDTEERRA